MIKKTSKGYFKCLPKNLYFTSDTHFWHDNIIKYCNRPFNNVEEMNDTLIDLINDTVPPQGTLFHLGDFAFTGNIERLEEILARINCDVHLIMGNHDYQSKYNRESVRNLFESVHDTLYLVVDDEEMDGEQGIFLCHYPMATWNQAMKGSWNLFGHIHSGQYSSSSEDKVAVHPAQYDVGVDNNNFKPVSYEEIKIILTKRFLGS